MQLEATITINGQASKVLFQHQSIQTAEKELTESRLKVTNRIVEISKKIQASNRFHGTNNQPRPQLVPRFPVVIFGKSFSTPQDFIKSEISIKAV